MERDNIKVGGHLGTWYVIEEQVVEGRTLYLLEHETYGDCAACLIVDENLEVVMDDVWNGFEDLEERDNFCIEVYVFSDDRNEDGSYDIIGKRKEYI